MSELCLQAVYVCPACCLCELPEALYSWCPYKRYIASVYTSGILYLRLQQVHLVSATCNACLILLHFPNFLINAVAKALEWQTKFGICRRGGAKQQIYIKISEAEIADDYPEPEQYEKVWNCHHPYLACMLAACDQGVRTSTCMCAALTTSSTFIGHPHIWSGIVCTRGITVRCNAPQCLYAD